MMTMVTQSYELAGEAIKHGALQKQSELAVLLDHVITLGPQIIVEIGSDTGGTLWLWKQVCETVYSIDLPGGNFSSQHTRPFEGHGAICYQGDSHTWRAREWLTDRLDGRPIDFLFIDGDHTYGGCKLDYDRYGPLVSDVGAVAFHDICWHGPGSTCQVDRVWQEVNAVPLPPGRVHEFISTPTHWGGIGLIYR